MILVTETNKLLNILHTSGAIQNGVPTNVFLFDVVFVNCPATPKSASFTSPVLLSNTFAAVRKQNNDYLGFNTIRNFNLS